MVHGNQNSLCTEPIEATVLMSKEFQVSGEHADIDFVRGESLKIPQVIRWYSTLPHKDGQELIG